MSWIKDGFWKNQTYRELTILLSIGGPVVDFFITWYDGWILFCAGTILTWSLLLISVGIAWVKRNRP